MSKPIKSMTRRDWWVFMTSSKGRANRFDYNVKFMLPCFVLNLIAAIIDYSYLGQAITDPQAKTYASWVAQIILLWPCITVSIKRLHDFDYSGWWLLTGYFIPVVIGSGFLGYFGAKQNVIGMFGVAVLLVCFVLTFILILCCAKGTKGPNRFGADPNDYNDNVVVEGASS